MEAYPFHVHSHPYRRFYQRHRLRRLDAEFRRELHYRSDVRDPQPDDKAGVGAIFFYLFQFFQVVESHQRPVRYHSLKRFDRFYGVRQDDVVVNKIYFLF